jgi:hypothetical protein
VPPLLFNTENFVRQPNAFDYKECMTAPFNPRAAIAEFLGKKLTGTQLLRGLATFRGWEVPARLESMVPVFAIFDRGEDRHFFMFSDKQAYLDCRAKIGIEAMGEYFISNLRGHSVFAALDDSVTVVNINPHCAQEIHYKKDQIPRLRSWARIIKTELALDSVEAKKTGYDAIRSFNEYYFIMEESQFIALAPDGRGRKLAALFTADDALDIFMERNGKPAMKPVPINGEKLFGALKKMPLDGMVFNCSGPVTPQAFPLSFADEVLANG